MEDGFFTVTVVGALFRDGSCLDAFFGAGQCLWYLGMYCVHSQSSHCFNYKCFPNICANVLSSAWHLKATKRITPCLKTMLTHTAFISQNVQQLITGPTNWFRNVGPALRQVQDRTLPTEWTFLKLLGPKSSKGSTRHSQHKHKWVTHASRIHCRKSPPK